MYKRLKQFLKAIVPKRLLLRYESAFRFIIYQFYKGEKYQCNICKKGLREFVQTEGEDKLCPNCGSLPRTRRLWKLLSSGFIKNGITILDFSPSRSIYHILSSTPGINYISSDLSGNFLSEKKYDITKIDSPGESFELIICYHILEHIENDIQAMAELFRVLKKNGTCIIQTPFKEGDIYEEAAAKSDAERLHYYGQKDHIRIYSASGLQKRLEKCGFRVMINEYQEPPDNKFGLKRAETILICKK